MPDGQLIFPESHLLDGFTTNVTSRQAGEPDPVVRELLQNCLDAAVREANRECAEVNFTIAQRPIEDLPGLSKYLEVFQSAKSGITREPTHDVRSAISRIDRAISIPHMSVLFCRDNGVGVDAKRMQALLSEGQSDKAAQGAGSFGLGHLTAYAASDLRYVLYAGRMEGRDIASGHTILASHKVGATRYSSHGYWMTKSCPFSLENGDFPDIAPGLIRRELSKIDESGAVVAIAGFNFFHEDDQTRALDHICEVAALNFLGAVWEKKMVVRVVDEGMGREKMVDAKSLESFLHPIRQQQRARARGWLPGQQGYRALETLRNGTELQTDIDRSVKVIFRRLAANSNDRSRVQIFRDGMWITNSEPEIQTGAFNGVQPFDAVVLLSDADAEDHTEFYDLLRNAEGPEHRGLTKRRELSKSDRSALRGMLQKIANRLREEAGAIDADQGFSPPGFAIFDSAIARTAAPVPRLRRRFTGSESDDDGRGTDLTGVESDEPDSGGTSGNGNKRNRRRRSPTSGPAVRIRRTIVPRIEESDEVRFLTAVLEFAESPNSTGSVGLRVFVESGSDETCERPLPPLWQKIKGVTLNGKYIAADDEFEVGIPHANATLEIELAKPVAPLSRFELDVIRYKTKTSLN